MLSTCAKRRFSYSYISEKLKISKSTLSDWLKKIPYIPNKYTKDKIKKSRVGAMVTKNRQKIANLEKASKEAISDIGIISSRDIMFLGLGLYLGDGTKSQESVRVINSDPDIIRLSIEWFKIVCGLRTKNFSLSIHMYPDNNQIETLKFWSKKTKIPIKQFGKSQIDTRVKKSRNRNRKLPHGTAHLLIKSNGNKRFGVFLHRKIMAWISESKKQILRD